MAVTPEKHSILTFVAYTALGYLALVLHHWVFAPEMAESVTIVRVLLVIANLTAGGCCFLKALRWLWPARRVDDGP